MPRPPGFAPRVQSVSGRVYSTLAERAAAAGPVSPLHIGDTWMEPPVGCRMQDLTVEDWPGMHRYAPVRGRADLLGAIAEWLRARGAGPVEPGEVLLGAGATGGLGAVVGALVAPGEEVLLLAPYWPLIAGIVRTFDGVPVPVSILDVDGSEALIEALDAARTERAVAVYLNTPHNPTGRVFPESWVAAVAEWARRHDLWVITDEVYEHYVYEGVHARGRVMAPERTFSSHSFSKAYGMAGNRCGFVVGPRAFMGELTKVSTHTFYSTTTASQIAALCALQGPGDAWAADAARQYAALGRDAAAALGVSAPQGSTFLFVDVAARLDDRGLQGFLEDCADRGLLLAPGPSFGPFPTHVRACFTSAPPDVVRRGFTTLAGLLGR